MYCAVQYKPRRQPSNATEGERMARPGATREDPRVARTRSVVLGAAADLLAERGYAAFTMDALVARTGVSKTTMYKHWPSRTILIAATVGAMATDPAAPDTGDVR